jgi:DNA repair protein SbcD/Mre11
VLIAHLADLHLGYRAYHRLAVDGVNQRERDISDAVGRVITQVIEAGPDLVLVAGDVFHTVRPSNAAIMDGFRHFMRLRRGLPSSPVVMIAGNHDAPRSADTGSILRLLAEIPDVHVVDDAARTIRLAEQDASVLCLPHAALMAGAPARLAPGDASATNILMLHGTVSGTGVDDQLLRMAEFGGAQIDRAALDEDVWDYIALGHYHNATRVAPHVWYAGAPERTATNVWAEADTRKGWVLYDTEARQGHFQDVRVREVVDLPRFSARDTGPASEGGWMTPAEVDRRIGEAVDALPGGVAGRIVRLVIADIPRDLFRQLDHRRIRAIKAEALHFQLEARRPDTAHRSTNPDTRRRTLEEEVTTFLDAWEPTTAGIDRARLVALGAEYLAAAAAGGSGAGTEEGSLDGSSARSTEDQSEDSSEGSTEDSSDGSSEASLDGSLDGSEPAARAEVEP